MTATGPERGAVELSLVVPFYNPGGDALRDTVVGAMAVLDGAGVAFEIIAVSDGATDGSPDALRDVGDPRLHLLELPRNVGKGRAVREGLALGSGRFLGFIDADGDIPVELLADFMGIARTVLPDAVLGSKRHPESKVTAGMARRTYSAGYQLLVRPLFGLGVRDTQTGLKIFRRDVLNAVLPLAREDRFALDVELLALARFLGYRRMVEAPVTIRTRLTTTISFRTVGSLLRDTLAVGWRLRFRRSQLRRPVAGDPEVLLRPLAGEFA